MYPFITIAGIHIEITGIGIIMGFIIFGLVALQRARLALLPFGKLYYALPAMISLIYLGGSYGSFVLRNNLLFPANINHIHSIILPESYNFHAGGMMLSVVVFLVFFINKQSGRLIKYKRIDTIFISMMRSFVVLGLFLVIGDDVIGLPTQSTLGVSAMTPYSQVSKFNKVYPVGFFLSIAALVSYIISFFLKKISRGPGRGFASFGVFLILFSIVLLYQQYPRHGVIIVGNMRYDINQYIAWAIALLCFFRYISIIGSYHIHMSKRIIKLEE